MQIKNLKNFNFQFTINHRPIFGCCFKTHFSQEGDKTKIDLSNTLRRKGSLIGFGPIYFTPNVMGVKDAEDAFAAEQWFKKKIGKKLYDKASVSIGLDCLTYMLFTGFLEFDRLALLANAGNLYMLDKKDVDTSSKIKEIKAVLKRYKYSDLKERPGQTDQLFDILAELHFARLAIDAGLKIKLGKTPDLTIDGIGTEVKRLNWNSLSIASTNKIDDLRIEAKKQRAQLVVIENWGLFSSMTRKKGIKTFLSLFREIKRNINHDPPRTIFFNYDIWRDAVFIKPKALNPN